jgi:hypothetical protein
MTRTTLQRQLALAVAIAAAAAPSASARPIDEFPRTEPAKGAPQVRVVHESGFDWGDAGAGAAFAATMLGLGGAFVIRNRHRRVEATS